MNSSRRKFFKHSLSGAATLAVMPSFLMSCAEKKTSTSTPDSSSEAMNTTPTYFDHIGVQLYTVRNAFAENGKATLENIAKIGYKEIELHDAALIPEYAPIIEDLGMDITSTHFNSSFITGNWAAYGRTAPEGVDFKSLLAGAEKYGVEHMVMPMLMPSDRGDLDHYKKLASTFNEFGKLCKSARINFCYHNHNFEFEPMGDSSPMEVLLAETDPELVSFELDVFWVSAAGIDPAAFMKKHSGRIRLLHLKDLKAGAPQTFKTIETSQKSPEIFVEVGNGQVDFEKVLTTAKEIGVTNCYVEQDHSADALSSLAMSYQHLQLLAL